MSHCYDKIMKSIFGWFIFGFIRNLTFSLFFALVDITAEPTDQSAQRPAELHLLEVVRDEEDEKTCGTLLHDIF